MFEDHRIERRELFRRAGVVGAGLALPGFLAACGSSSETSSRGGTLSVGATDWLPADFYNGTVFGPQSEGMMQMAWSLFIGGGGDGRGVELRNGLAASYEPSSDGISHVITIRKGLKFHDGSPIDAEAVVANLRAGFFKKDPLRGPGAWEQVTLSFGDPVTVKSVEATGPLSLAIQLTKPQADIRNGLAYMFILNPKILATKGYGTDAAQLAKLGSGPFRVTRFQPGSFVELERFDGFFEDVLPDRVRLESVADPGALALAIRGGEISVASGLAKNDFDSLLKNGYQSVTSALGVNIFMQFATPADDAFRDKRVRQAMELAMNREAYTKSFFSAGTAIVSNQPIVVPGMGGYNDSLDVVPYDVDAAKALMAEAGVSSAKLSVIDPTSFAPISSMKGILEAIAGDVGQIGIELDVNLVDFGTYIAESSQHGAAVTAYGATNNPFILFDLFFRGPLGQRAPTDLRSAPAINALLDQAHEATMDPEKQDALLARVVAMAKEEAIALPISQARYAALAAEGVKGFPLSSQLLDSWHRVSISS